MGFGLMVVILGGMQVITDTTVRNGAGACYTIWSICIFTYLYLPTAGWNDVSWHNPNIHSPTLERLAAEGVVLDQYYVQPTCSPSRVAFMTGQYPYR